MTLLSGLGTALITPFKEDYSIDFEGLKRLIEYISDHGCDYLVVNGTTGESAATTDDEKNKLLAFVKSNNPKKLPIVYGLGGNNTSESLKKIQNTDFAGISAILSVTPYYIMPSQASIIAHFTAIADDAPVPVILYNVPGRTVVGINPDTILKLSLHPNIVGVKDASSSLEQAMELAKKTPKEFFLISGDDNLVTPQISIGYDGVISVIGNGFPAEFHKMVHAALNGDFKTASALQYRFLDFDTLLYKESNPVGIKMVAEIRKICDSHTRMPLLKASPELKEELIEAMKREGFL